MIGFIRGSIVYIDSEYLIIDSNGLGYEVKYNNNLTNSSLGNEIKLFVTHTINEFSQALYGFDSIDEKLIFESLTSIKGVGNKAMFQVMSGLSVKRYNDLLDVKLEDLTKINGIGKAIAQKILLGISQKVKSNVSINEIINVDTKSDKYREILNSLKPLGFSETSIKSVLSTNKGDIEKLESEELVKYILRKLK